jgi:hypothetical protein
MLKQSGSASLNFIDIADILIFFLFNIDEEYLKGKVLYFKKVSSRARTHAFAYLMILIMHFSILRLFIRVIQAGYTCASALLFS